MKQHILRNGEVELAALDTGGDSAIVVILHGFSEAVARWSRE